MKMYFNDLKDIRYCLIPFADFGEGFYLFSTSSPSHIEFNATHENITSTVSQLQHGTQRHNRLALLPPYTGIASSSLDLMRTSQKTLWKKKIPKLMG